MSIYIELTYIVALLAFVSGYGAARASATLFGWGLSEDEFNARLRREEYRRSRVPFEKPSGTPPRNR